MDGSLPLTPVSGTGQALPSPPGLGERVGVRGFMRVKAYMGTFIKGALDHGSYKN